MKNINDKTTEKILRDTKHNKKANTVFLKLLANQKSKRRDWSDVRAETLITEEKSDIRNEGVR